MTSIASNEKFKFNPKIFYFVSLIIIIITTFIFLDYFFLNIKIFNIDIVNQSTNLIYKLSINKFINYPSIIITLLIIIYLLISLIAIVKITEIQYGPIRQKF